MQNSENESMKKRKGTIEKLIVRNFFEKKEHNFFSCLYKFELVMCNKIEHLKLNSFYLIPFSLFVACLKGIIIYHQSSSNQSKQR